MYLSGFYGDARRAIKRAIELRPQCYSALMTLSAILGELSLDDEQMLIFDRCIELSPHNPEAYADKAEALAVMSRFAEAEALARKALVLHQAYRYEDDFEEPTDASEVRDFRAVSIYTTLVYALDARGATENVLTSIAEAKAFGIDESRFEHLGWPTLRAI